MSNGIVLMSNGRQFHDFCFVVHSFHLLKHIDRNNGTALVHGIECLKKFFGSAFLRRKQKKMFHFSMKYVGDKNLLNLLIYHFDSSYQQ